LQKIKKEVFKTVLVFTYINLFVLPFVYVIGSTLFSSYNWLQEVRILKQDQFILTLVVFSLLELYFLFLAVKFKVEKD